ncbi:FAS1-like dehydratase domain-containing protein [Pseudogracilibacillus auburnensis]|uniref:FAS1-like dehydratase domain-containing protein n=1 Tax=Pseudogracilibacillus auburnensis TaxID=1494959 RepID=UPI001A97D089|nr:MaoC family dehydratase N-terminal domain-containing protein [Pseudogracilibacillus auburnensis]MBO1001737.1 MaoC family dehydratase N-terminal domain-containing protein [Pseudogracilibacillus auburnensis]
MIDESKVGTKTKIVNVKVKREEIQQLCHVIDEKNHVFHDVNAASEAGFEDILLSPTYPILFWQHLEPPWLETDATIIQSEQIFSYKTPLVANKMYQCQIELLKVRTRENKQFVVNRLYINDGEKVVATSDTTLVLLY